MHIETNKNIFTKEFLDRYYNKTVEKILTLKTKSAIDNNIIKFYILLKINFESMSQENIDNCEKLYEVKNA